MPRHDAGYVTVGFLGTAALTLAGLVVVTNLLMVRYTEGVLHAAVESGARQALAAGSAQACTQRVSQYLQESLGSIVASAPPPVCVLTSSGASARIEARLRGWLPLVPPRTAVATATAAGRSAAAGTGFWHGALPHGAVP